MRIVVGQLGNRISAVIALALIVSQLSSTASAQIRSNIGNGGLQRIIGSRSSSPDRRGSDKTVQKRSGSFINRYFPDNSPVKRAIGAKKPLPQPNASKSQFLTKYGAAANGNLATAPPKNPALPATTADPAAPSNAASQQPDASQTTVAAGVAANPAPGPAGDADLVLEGVKFFEPATDSLGPSFRVTFRNQGIGAAGRFRIGAFAERDDKLSDDAPHVVTEVASLAAGATSEVTMRLPLAAVRLTSASAPDPVPFDQLLVVIDLDDSVVESEKGNNVLDLKRTELEAAAR
jgi:hypothetical protein